MHPAPEGRLNTVHKTNSASFSKQADSRAVRGGAPLRREGREYMGGRASAVGCGEADEGPSTQLSSGPGYLLEPVHLRSIKKKDGGYVDAELQMSPRGYASVPSEQCVAQAT